MINKTKTCSKCHKTKLLDEFSSDKTKKDGKYPSCKKCVKKYQQEHKREIAIQHKVYYEKTGRGKQDKISMYENKSCGVYLGIVIAERLCRHLFNDVEIMPHGNVGYDFICNKGKKIDVKSASTTLNNGKYPRWLFTIDRNTLPDYFILIAFDNRIDLNPIHLFMIPGSEINHRVSKTLFPSTIHKWDKWKRSIEEVQLCCTEIKSKELSPKH